MIVICPKTHICANLTPICDHKNPHEKGKYGCGERAYCGYISEVVPCVEVEQDKRYDVQWE